MNHEVWLSLSEVEKATGWSSRTIFRKSASGDLRTRTTGKKSANGKPVPEYASSSLPSEVQLTLFQQRMSSEALVIASKSPHPIKPKLPAPSEQDRVAISGEAKAQAETRLAIIGPMIDFVNNTNGHKPVYRTSSGMDIFTLTAVVEHIATVQQLSASTLWGWYDRYRKSGFAALADRQRSDNGLSRYFRHHENVAEFARNKFLNERLSVQLVHESIARNWDRLRKSVEDVTPSYTTLRVYLNSLPPIITAVARQGERKFNEDFAPFIIRNIEAKRCNEYWISDHMVHDVWVRNDGVFGELKNNEAFRPWLTCIVDMRSRKVVGSAWCVNPSSTTISSALRMGITRYGIPQIFYIDNGKDYKRVGLDPSSRPDISPEAAGVLFRLGIQSQHCLPRHPQSKQIESFFKTLHQRFDVMWRPFYCGVSPKERPEECDNVLRDHKKLMAHGEGDKSILPAASEFIHLANAWLDEFNTTFPHSGQGMKGKSPDQVYSAELPEQSLSPVNPAAVAELFWDRQKRIVAEGGCVNLFNARYEPSDPESFAALACEIKREVLVACDPHNVGVAIALSMDGKFLGSLRAQELLVHGDPLSRDKIAASMRVRRKMFKAAKNYLGTLERTRTLAGDVTELQSLAARSALSVTQPNIHALPVLRAVNESPVQRMRVDDIVDSFYEEKD